MGRAVATLCGILVLALVAGCLTEASFAYGHGIGNDPVSSVATVPAKSASPTPSPTKAPASTPIATPTFSPTPTPTPSATPSTPTAATNSFVHLRSQMSTASTILANLNADTTVILLSGGDSSWQEVSVDGYDGYVYRTYLNY